MLNTIHLFHMHYLETLQRNEGNRSHIPENRLGLDGTEKWGRIGFFTCRQLCTIIHFPD